ncbi:MAG: TIM44-like domain-containing protein, partial [Caldimonas sp.]
ALPHGRSSTLRCAILVAAALAFASGEASAGALRNPSGAFGALAVFAGLLFMREWPLALTGSIWAAGFAFVAALWFLRARYRAELSTPNVGSVVQPLGKAVLPPGPVLGSLGSVPGSVADTGALLGAARRCFVDLQAAWDLGDIAVLRERTTPEMLEELLQELPLRGLGPNRTDVLTLDAALIGFERLGSRCLASIEFSGMIREHAEQGAAPFKEVWMLTCAEADRPDWRLARQQALL